MEAEEKLREQIAIRLRRNYRFDSTGQFIECVYSEKETSDQILSLIKEAGYLPVEPVQLEVLGDEEIGEAIKKHTRGFEDDARKCDITKAEKAISQATITHNEEKFGKLYRRVE